MRMCWAAFALDAEESGWDDYITSRKSISSSPSLSIANEPAAATTATASAVASPTTPTSASIPGPESSLWTSSNTTFEPATEWRKEIGAAADYTHDPVIVDVDADVDMMMDMDMDLDVSHHDVLMSTTTTTTTTTIETTQVVTPSEQQEWQNTIDAQIEEGRKQLEMTTIQIEERVEEVIKPAKRYIPTKITAYFPSSPAVGIPMHLRPSSADIIVTTKTTRSRRGSLRGDERSNLSDEEEAERQRELLEELAKSLSSVSIRTTRTRTQTSTQVVKSAKPPPIGIGMMMGFKSVKNGESLSPRLKAKEVDFNTAPTKITKRGVITGGRGGSVGGRARGTVMKRRNSGGSYRGETISL